MTTEQRRKAAYIRQLIKKAETQRDTHKLRADELQASSEPHISQELLTTLTIARIYVANQDDRISDLKLQLIACDETFDPAAEAEQESEEFTPTTANIIRESKISRYAHLRSQGLCGYCGLTKSVSAMCDRCAKTASVANRDRRANGKARDQILKAQGLCVECGKRPPKPGKSVRGRKYVRCEDCIVKANARSTAFWEKQGVTASAYTREYRDRRVADGLCSRCGNPNNGSNKYYCPACVSEQAARNKRAGDERVAQGLCASPGCPNPHREGRRTCQSCGDKAQAAAKRHATNVRA